MTKVVILAAGQGTRLHPYTKDVPKCMVKIEERTLLEHQLDIIRSIGIDDINLVAGYQCEKLKSYNLPIFFNKEYDTTNMLYSLFCAEKLMQEDGDLIIAYGDIVYSAEILKVLLSSSDPISVIIDQNWQSYWEARFDDILEDAETLVVNEYDKILEIGSKTTDISEIQGQYIGLLKITKKGKSIFRNEYAISEKNKCNSKKRENAYMTDFLQQLISKGYSVQGVRVSSPWIEIDQPKDMNNKITLERLHKIKRSYN